MKYQCKSEWIFCHPESCSSQPRQSNKALKTCLPKHQWEYIQESSYGKLNCLLQGQCVMAKINISGSARGNLVYPHIQNKYSNGTIWQLIRSEHWRNKERKHTLSLASAASTLLVFIFWRTKSIGHAADLLAADHLHPPHQPWCSPPHWRRWSTQQPPCCPPGKRTNGETSMDFWSRRHRRRLVRFGN
jgi:hypothetical protein